ncbi:hypothetical protein ADICYQ_1025 [Cyclobacterium qasimii M12-11B]|uniref:Uncharacterized protein n=1 Tax=Cyclobacterium qasimii M12-11B TaxID=641524 RepID=S7X2R2_9BACT|nr:hypothetical protein ADICYQ_1025 [Cyclobacterium qasimii M12-11B]
MYMHFSLVSRIESIGPVAWNFNFLGLCIPQYQNKKEGE